MKGGPDPWTRTPWLAIVLMAGFLTGVFIWGFAFGALIRWALAL